MADISPLLAEGIQRHQAGQFDEALAIYQQGLALDPENADLLNLLGAVSINLRQWQAAVDHLQHALRVNPAHAGACENLGVLLARHERYHEAIVNFRQALAANPNGASTYLNLAAALERTGQNAEAIEAYEQVVQLAPNTLRAHRELAKLYDLAQRPAEAALHGYHAARLLGNDPRALFEAAARLAQTGQLERAIAAYTEVLKLKPDSGEACVNLAQLCIVTRKYPEAVVWGRRAVEIRPQLAAAYINLGSALSKTGQWAEAASALESAVRLKPDSSEAHNNLGIVLAEQGQFAAASAAYREALALDPHDADTFYNLGTALVKQNDPEAAIAQFDRAIAERADYGEAHHNRSAALLSLGHFVAGFAEYEWRFRSRDFPSFQSRWPIWKGEPLAGRTIVLVGEQGLGDTLQFVRYAPMVRQQGARVLVECSPALHKVLARTPGVDGWIGPKDPRPEADFAVPMMSLPWRMGTTLDTVPREIPYVEPDPEAIERWREKLAAMDGFRVGVVWQGNPNCPGDNLRSIPLAHYAALAEVPGVRLVSLQKGPGIEQLAEWQGAVPIVDFGPALDTWNGAFVDTAAIMRQLDLVITSDTAAAHLAGALGVPVWLALQFSPDWRWLLGREDSPWYPTMRLFRQQDFGDWHDVFENLAAQLRITSQQHRLNQSNR